MASNPSNPNRETFASVFFARLIIIIFGLLGLFFSRNMIYSYLTGPHECDVRKIDEENEKFIRSKYLDLWGDTIISLNIGEYRTRRGQRVSKFSSASSHFYLFVHGNKQIVLKLPSSHSHWQEKAVNASGAKIHYTGKLSEIDPDDELVELLNGQHPGLYNRISPYLLEVKKPVAEKAFSWIFLVVFGLIVVTSVFAILVKAIRG